VKRFSNAAVRAKDRRGTTVTEISSICKVCGKAGTIVRRPDNTYGLKHKCEPAPAGEAPSA